MNYFSELSIFEHYQFLDNNPGKIFVILLRKNNRQ
jgi:hypothetical protein